MREVYCHARTEVHSRARTWKLRVPIKPKKSRDLCGCLLLLPLRHVELRRSFEYDHVVSL